MTNEHLPPRQVPLAIIGIGCMFPKAGNVQSYWRNIREGVDAITDVPPTHWKPEDYFDPDKDAPDMTYARRGGFIDPVPFDPLLYGISPNNIEATDTTQLLGLVAARAALLDAGYATGRDTQDGRPFDRDRTSVILGVTGTLELVIPLGARLGHPLWRCALRDAGVDAQTAEEVVKRIAEGYVPWQENSFPGLLGNVTAGRIANRFDLGGTNCVVDAACASSLSAIHMAAMELQAGRCDMAISGGADTFNDIFMYMCFSKTPALSPTGNCRPFHAHGDGTILGEGIGVVVLKRLADAERDRDRVYAVIKGIGASSDGKGNAIYAPSAAGQQKALREACRTAAVTPRTIELVEAHGTGTRVGDAVEAAALSAVYREDRPLGTWCALGSVKSMIGHTKAAAGAAGLIKIALALHHKVLPPTIKVEQPLEVLQPGTAPVYVNTIKRPWPARPEHPRRAAVSAFGFGGSNFHAVLEEAEHTQREIEWDGAVLLSAFSGADDKELLARLDALEAAAGDWPALRRAAALSLRNYNAAQDHRLVMVLERDRAELGKMMQTARAMLSGADAKSRGKQDGVFYGRGKPPGGLAFMFPGQGSQYPGMQRDLACQFPQMLSALEEANAVLGEDAEGCRLSDRIYPIPVFDDAAREEQRLALTATATAQPAIGAVSVGAARVLEHFGVRADACAGHSFGELTALNYAGWFADRDLPRLARKRGQLMQQGEGDRGAMLAVFSTPETLYGLIEEHQLDLIIANHNAPSQLVLSGATDQIGRAESVLARRKIRCSRLPVAAAFHSSFVAGAEKPYAEYIQEIEFTPGRIPVYSNTTAECYGADVTQARALLAGQLARPVEFVRVIENMYAAGIRTFVEAGPSSVLTGLIGKILDEREHHAIALDHSKGRRSGQYDLALALARLSALGCHCDLSRWDAGFLETLREEKPPALTIHLCGANYVQPRAKRTPASREIKPAPVQTPAGAAAAAPAVDTKQPANPVMESAPAGSAALQAIQQGILALQKLQEQTALLHKQFLEGQENAQRTLQQLIQQQQLLSGAPVLPSAFTAPQIPLPVTAPVTPAPSRQTAPASMERPEPAGEEQPARLVPRYKSILLEVVAVKTGYPVEMLNLDMNLDSDLGIDSIKRVEILSAFQDRVPDAPAVKPEELAVLQTLRQIVEYMERGIAGISAAPAPSGAGDLDRMQRILLEVVAVKTGYPVEMLNLDMNLDSDLGIDSIKRVEILSAFQDQVPDAPAVKPEELGRLQTLRQILDYMHQEVSAAPPTPETRTVPAPAREPESAGLFHANVVLRPLAASGRQTLDLPTGARILVTDDGTELANKIGEILKERGYEAEVVPLDAKITADTAALIVLAPAQPDRFFIRQAFALIQQAGRLDVRNVCCVTRLGGGFGFQDPSGADPAAAAILGIVKTAAREWPMARCKCIDIPAGRGSRKLARAIVEEILTAGPLEVGIRNRDCITLALQRTDGAVPGMTQTPFTPGDTVVVCGGARGITAEVALALAQTYHVNLLVFGRSAEPAPEPEWLARLQTETEIKQALLNRQAAGRTRAPKDLAEEYQRIIANRELLANLARLRETGVHLAYRAVDVRDAQQVAAIIDQARRELGPIRGIFHGAGVLADRLIVDKTPEQFDQVYTTKVDGLRTLLRATEKDDLKVLVLFSSSTARFGRKGQADYAAANEVLNKIAQYEQRQRPGCRVLSVNWGPWAGGMVTPALATLFASEGVGLIPLPAGAELLMREIAGTGPVEIVVLGSAPLEDTTVQPADSGFDGAMQPAFERHLNAEDYPVLQSHVMNGRAVLPAALIAEWLAHGAMHRNPGLTFTGFEDFRIYKGVILENGDGVTLRILAGTVQRQADRDVVPVELRGGNTLHARARIILRSGYDVPSASAEPLPAGLRPYRDNEFYRDGSLFHGRDLQGLTTVTVCSERGIAGEARTAPAPSHWMKHPIRSTWLADPLILDACFQLMILWSCQHHGAGSLPTAIAGYRQYQRSYPKDGARIIARIKHSARHQAIADIEILDKHGKLVATLQGYECVIDASLNEAFRKNQITNVARME